MAHMIEHNDKLACTGSHPWHFAETNADGRTVMVGKEPQSGKVMLETALPWEPVKVPLFYSGSLAEGSALLNRAGSELGRRLETRDLRSAESFAIVRNDGQGLLTAGKAVSAAYTPFLNADMVRLGDLLVESGEAKWHTLGSLMGGRHVFGALQAAGEIVVNAGWTVDVVTPFLMLFQAHDGTHSLEVMFTSIRPVCHNTVTAARAGARKAKVRHTAQIGDVRNVADRVTEILGIAHESFREQQEVLSDLARIEMNRNDFVEFAAQIVTGEDEVEAARKVFRDAKGASLTKLTDKAATLLGCIENGIGQAQLPDSGYKALQGLAEFIDYQRGRSVAWRAKNKAAGLNGALFGSGAEAKKRGVELLLRRRG